MQKTFGGIDRSNLRIWQSAERPIPNNLVVAHLALLSRNLASGWTKFRGSLRSLRAP
jgi:hypothetical protein